MAELFCNGGAMRGGNLHHTVAHHRFLGAVKTTPKYRFFSVRDEFPALLRSEDAGAEIEGELYDVPMENIRTDFLPAEPAELELTVVELADGRSVLAVAMRPGLVDSIADQLTEITEERSWRKYRGLSDPA